MIRESGGDRCAVTGGTRVLSDRIVVRVTQEPGQSFLDRMIALVEGAGRQRTPKELALNLLLVMMTFVFLVAVVTLQPMAIFSKDFMAAAPDTLALTADDVTGIVLVSLLVCLIPTTIGGLLSAIGIAGMDRLVQRNVLAMSGRAVEAAGDVHTLLLDKTGTITHGNRRASELLPVGAVTERQLADAALLSSLADETPEGRSVVAYVQHRFGLERHLPAGPFADGGGSTASVPTASVPAGFVPAGFVVEGDGPADAVWVPFAATTRMSGVDLPGGIGAHGTRRLRKGAAAAVARWVEDEGGEVPASQPPAAPRSPSPSGRPAGAPGCRASCTSRTWSSRA
ncbi:hypothetical protein Sm713_60460 [Streptomyces sp. TS71-3]|nr:hypothetical protein Sm713_60460 [Streptomyces sp. TS71-3]